MSNNQGGVSAMSAELGAVTSTSGTAQKTFTLDDFMRMAAALSSMPPEPIGQWMREKGYPPEEWALWLPSSFKAQGPAIWPTYVQFSSLIDQPLFLKTRMVFGL